MKFEEALAELRKGKKIYIKDVYQGLLHLSCDTIMEGKYRETIVNSIPCYFILSDKWEIYEEGGKTFDEVLVKYKQGSGIRRKSHHPSKLLVKYNCGFDLSEEDLLANDWEVIDN